MKSAASNPKLRSSIYRGILFDTEMAATSFSIADFYTRDAQGIDAEYDAYQEGACR
jgi:hypothetical protein